MRLSRSRYAVGLALVLALATAGCSSPQATPSSSASVSGGTPSATASSSTTPSAAKPGAYVALGDSLAAGFQPGSGDLRESSYPALAASRLGALGSPLTLTNLACSGETTTSLTKGGRCEFPEGNQLAAAEAAIRAAGSDLRLVTIDIGGNDLLFCARGGKVDQACTVTGRKTVDANLPGILTRLRAAAGDKAQIIVLGYYNPWLAATIRSGSGVDAGASAAVVADLNARIAKHAKAAGVSYLSLDETFNANDTTPTTVQGNQLPANVAAICELTYACTFGDVHLTDEGAVRVAGTIVKAVQAAASP